MRYTNKSLCIILVFLPTVFYTQLNDGWIYDCVIVSSCTAIKSHVETLNAKGKESGSYSLLSIDEKYNHLLVGGK